MDSGDKNSMNNAIHQLFEKVLSSPARSRRQDSKQAGNEAIKKYIR